MDIRIRLKPGAFGLLAYAALAFTGCSVPSRGSVAADPTCELSVSAVCSQAINSYRGEEAIRSANVKPWKGTQLEPMVMPVMLPSGELAAEADCYVAISRDEIWVVYAQVAISPTSSRAVEYLGDRGLCIDAGSERRLASGH